MPLPNPPTRPRKEEKERIQAIEDYLSGVDRRLQDMKDFQGKMDVLDERTERMEQTAERSFNAIFGANGNPGILTRLAAVENTTSDIKKALEKVLWAVIIGGGSLFVEQIVSLILQHGPGK